MAVICPACRRQFDHTLFEFGNTVQCVCGHVITAPAHTIDITKQKKGRDPGDQEEPPRREKKRS